MTFEYLIEDKNKDVVDVEEGFCAGRRPLAAEKINITKDKDGLVQLQANKDGWLYLAKVCIEMAYCAGKDPYYHIHRTEKFEVSNEAANDAIGLFILK